MKPVESYSAINTRMDRPISNGAAAKKADAAAGTSNAKETNVASTTASKLAADKPPFDVQKVADMRQKIAAGDYRVDTDALAAKMLDVGVIGVESKE